jgi:dipeptidyl aminopeptidase/acylaminoacyl peptidase
VATLAVAAPPRPPKLDRDNRLDQEALVKEARRRARRRRERNLAGILVATLGALSVYSLLGGGGPQSGAAFRLGVSPGSTASFKAALPEEISFNANNGIVLLRRDGTRQDLAPGVLRRQPNGAWRVLQYFGVEWSSDGSKLLALRFRSPARVVIELVVIDANGKIGPTIARNPLDAGWSPDGSRIAFVRHEPGAGRMLYVASNDGRDVTRIAPHLPNSGGFSWSPDGSELAYAGQGSSGLFIVNANGRPVPRRVVFAGAGASNTHVGTVRWSPNGTLIAFISGGHVDVVRADGTALRRVADGYDFAWSPDSSALAVVGPVGGRSWAYVWVVRADGAGLHRIAGCACVLRGPGASQFVAWSSDGTRISYISGRGNTVSTIHPDGTDATVVATQAARGLSGDWYPAMPLWRRWGH